MVKLVSRLVEVCVFAAGPAGVEYLLLRRSPGEKVYPDLWQFVTGSIENEETAVEAALREMAEETGLKPERFWVVPRVNMFYDPGRDAMNFLPVFAARVDAGTVPQLSGEHSEYKWCGYEEALGTLVWPGQRENLRIVRDFIAGSEPAGPRLRLF